MKEGEKMKYQINENVITLYLPKEVDHHSAEEIRRISDKMIEKNHIRHIVFDFKDTVFMDSSGIGVIMGRYKQISFGGGVIWAVNANERIQKILLMSGITKLIQVYGEEQSI